ncbi:ATP-binding protein [Breoghania sp. JC706]|uniref:ATP-binding protein n=1 Tax=Breoghania sp. JC706 TaxID=3117732 RepID=UPI0030082786
MKRSAPPMASRSPSRGRASSPDPSALLAILSDDAARILSAAAVLQKHGARFRFIESPHDLDQIARACRDHIEVVLVEDTLPRGRIRDLLRTGPLAKPGPGVRPVVLMEDADKALRKDARKAGAVLVAEPPQNSRALQRLLRPLTSPVSPSAGSLTRGRSEFGALLSGLFEIRTLEEAENLATLLASNTPEPEKVRLGIWELLSNAIEHGNLGITFEEKTSLLETGHFHEEISRRLGLDRYRDRVARVYFSLGPGSAHLKVSDDGPGFDFQEFMNSEPQIERPNGRGIRLVCQMCFDELAFVGTGNAVEATVHFREQANEHDGDEPAREDGDAS